MFFGGLKKVRRPAKKLEITSSGAKGTNNNYFEDARKPISPANKNRQSRLSAS